jgi:molybdopterin-guanine dinucleotide biosynthesis protein A
VTVTGVVLTGGASRRMGTDKALVEVDGVAMAVRVAAALAEGGCDPVVCQGGDAESLAALGMTVLDDTRPGGGPVSGILDALSEATAGSVVVCACDLPWLDGATVKDLIAVADARPDADVVVACDVAGPHLASVWRPGSRQLLEALVAGGMRSYRGALERLVTVHVEVPPAVVANVNSPGDLR